MGWTSYRFKLESLHRKTGNKHVNIKTDLKLLKYLTFIYWIINLVCCTHTPANKQVWFILNKTLQLNTVVPQSILSLHTVTVKEPEGYRNSGTILKTFCLLPFPVFVNCVHAERVAFVSYLAAWSFICTRLCRDVQLNSNSNMKLTCKQKREQAAEVTHFTWRKWSMSGLSRERAMELFPPPWTYFWLGAKYWIADVTRVAVGTKCCTLNLKVGILLHQKKRVRNRN